ncbi:tetratricopeptide repeat protein [Rubinisphaera sp.]|uniref:tetratricopeptide repeat protein n=1 Tax=Rubinisphaera sp. TaxID=2024857 RepID=UPI000C105F97|nr:tetratricopeptide repeat protein [Rubinisphaera sp.]MBV08948.1 hypothetical protein [Rubinisphaera sp.]HCS51734.1 hypothetical protein [Planctomycetaceae bacterium]
MRMQTQFSQPQQECQPENPLFRNKIYLGMCLTIAFGLLSFSVPASNFADEPTKEAVDPGVDATPPEALQQLVEMLSQPGDDVYEYRLPESATDEEVEKRRKAAAYYMTGRTFEHTNKFAEAYAAYTKALEIDNKSIALYKAIIPLAFRLDKVDEAIQYAQKAVELDADNFELLSQLGIYALRQSDIAGSIQYFEKAIESSTVDKKAGPYISIMSQLGRLYLSVNKTKEAANAYAIVFNAITHPDDYSLDFRTQRALETMQGDKSETFETFGELFLLTDQLDIAEQAFELAAEASTKNPEVFDYQMARVLTRKEKTAEALKKLNSYFEAKQQSKGKGPYLLLTELLIANDQEEEIIPQLEELLEQDPKNETLRLFLGEQYIANKRFDDAEKIFEALKDSKNQADIQLGLLQIYREQGDAQKTLTALAQAMMSGAKADRLEAELDLIKQDEELANAMVKIGIQEEQPEDAREAFTQTYLLAKLAMQQEEVDKVMLFYRRAMAIRDDRQVQVTLYAELIDYLNNLEEYDQLTEILIEAIDSPALSNERQAFQLQLIQVYVANEQNEKALKLIADVRETDPENLLWTYQEGRVHYLSEDWEEAIKVFMPLLEKAQEQKLPQIVREARYNSSRCLAFLGLPEEALTLINKAIQEEPDELLWRFQKGWIHYYTHNWDAAIKAFEELLALESKNPNDTIIRQAKFSLSAAYAQNDELDKAEEILEVFYNKNPDDISVCNDLGYLYADRGKKLDQAYEMIKKAIEAEPENHAYLDSMGWILYRMKKYDEAITYLEKAVEGSEEGDTVLWDHLGDCYQAIDKTEKAKEAWSNALKQEQAAKYPDQEIITKLKEKLGTE